MTRAPRILIVADDLTGAMDSAGPFAALGVETWVVAVPMRCDPATLHSANVVSVNTDTRHLSAVEAAARVDRISRHLGVGDFDVVIKKIDSTLRGNVVAETMALLDAGGRSKALVAPAFPAQGRTVHKGVVHVEGVPLAQTAFARDALSPPPLQSLHEVFAQSRTALRVSVVEPGGAFDSQLDVWVADSAVDADLSAAAAAMDVHAKDVLMVGSAGLTRALAGRFFEAHAAPTTLRHVTGTIVFAVGSRAARSAEQVDRLAGEPETAVLRAPNGKLPASRIPTARNLVLKATADAAGNEGDAESVAADMAKHAIELARHAQAEALVATGGDTAIAILAASDNPALQVLGDLMPGIPYARIRLEGAPLWLVTKAGGFGNPDTFRDVARRLRGT
ncbi:MAG TPA: four-carbon acid sugar kinase family protein [Burkholderiales bacterium]|nr:four-carbon acid sugar kinase family protein [Burkholderiales bacterium]